MPFEMIPVNDVAQIEMSLELFANDLRLVHLPRDPLVERRRRVVEVPLDVKLELLAVLVVVVAVQLDVVVGAELDQLGNAEVSNRHGQHRVCK